MDQEKKDNLQNFLERYRKDSEKFEGAHRQVVKEVKSKLKDTESLEVDGRAVFLYKLYCDAKKSLGQQVFFTRQSEVFQYFEKLALLLNQVEQATGLLVDDVDYITAAKLKYREVLSPSHLVSGQLWRYYIDQLLQDIPAEEINEDEFLETRDGKEHIESFLDLVDKGLNPKSVNLHLVDEVLLKSDTEFLCQELLDKLKDEI